LITLRRLAWGCRAEAGTATATCNCRGNGDAADEAETAGSPPPLTTLLAQQQKNRCFVLGMDGSMRGKKESLFVAGEESETRAE
jgi:hypothetical protein